MSSPEFQKEAFAQLTKIQLVFLTIAFVGFAADVSVAKSSIDRARDQLASIMDVVRMWDDQALNERAAKMVAEAQTAPAIFSFGVGPGEAKVIISLPPSDYALRPLPEPLEQYINGDASQANDLSPRISAPKSLAEFFTIWDSVGQMPVYTDFEPVDVLPTAKPVGSTHGGELRTSKVERLTKDPAEDTQSQRVTAKVSRIHRKDRETFKKFDPSHLIRATIKFDNKDWRITIYARGYSHISFVGQEVLVGKLPWPWHFLPSASAFKDLQVASISFAELPFEKSAAILTSEAERFGERVPILGVDLPKGQLAIWTLLLGSLVHLYFTVHLQALSAIPRNGPLTPAYPWIGILPGTAPWVVTLLLTAAIPIVFAVTKYISVLKLGSVTLLAKVGLAVAAMVLVVSALMAACFDLQLRRSLFSGLGPQRSDSRMDSEGSE
jgi:hypothetical protein